MPEMAREYTRVGGQMETAKKQRTARLNPRWCSPNDADKDYKVMELLRPAVLGCCDSLGVHWSGAWSHSVRPGSRPKASHGWRAHVPTQGWKDVLLLEKQCRYHRCVRRHARAVSA